MGCLVSCAVFKWFSLFVEWKPRGKVGWKTIAHYLDDYFFCGERNSGKCRFILNSFQLMAEELGLSLAEEKTEGPATFLTFLGIELDTIQQMSQLPKNKLADLRIKITALLQK